MVAALAARSSFQLSFSTNKSFSVGFSQAEKTISANIAVTLPIYIVFTIALIVFSAWLNPTLKNVFVDHNMGDDLAANAATMVCSAVQFFLYFPVDKILFHKKKEEKE